MLGNSRTATPNQAQTCEQAWCSPTQDQADPIGKDLADGAAPLSRVRERLMNGDLRLPQRLTSAPGY